MTQWRWLCRPEQVAMMSKSSHECAVIVVYVGPVHPRNGQVRGQMCHCCCACRPGLHTLRTGSMSNTQANIVVWRAGAGTGLMTWATDSDIVDCMDHDDHARGWAGTGSNTQAPICGWQWRLAHGPMNHVVVVQRGWEWDRFKNMCHGHPQLHGLRTSCRWAGLGRVRTPKPWTAMASSTWAHEPCRRAEGLGMGQV